MCGMTGRREYPPICTFTGCEGRHASRGFCVKHLRRWEAHGDPTVVLNGRGTPLIDRFRERIVQLPNGCWLWIGAVSGSGYGRFSTSHTRSDPAHRWAYEYFVGPIPPGLVIDHLCRMPLCVNPEHLEPVTQQENVLRGDTPAARNVAKTHCPQGHAYDSVGSKGERTCRRCRNAQAAASRQRVAERNRS